jgi:beta-catenin-like protein 1
MTSLDDLFKKPSLPSSNKRKPEPLRDPSIHYKAAKLSQNDTANGNGRAAHASVADENDEDIEGPVPPPAGGEDEEAYGQDIPDDEDGRFFGGGISKDEAEVLDYMDSVDDTNGAPEKLDVHWLRKTALNFEKRISKNAELRAKYENEPAKFMASEADLDADIKALSILTEDSALYSEFAKLGCAASLVSLLAHENTDIAIDAIQIISELTDDSVEAESEDWDALIDAMVDADLLNLLTANLDRLDEKQEADREGVYHVLAVFENLASSPRLAANIGKDTSLFPYLLKRLQVKESPVTQNKHYAAEILFILLQATPSNPPIFAEKHNGTDVVLQLLAPYRRRDPADDDEEEVAANLFDALTTVLDTKEGKQKFVEAEGVELALIMVKEGKFSQIRALSWLDHALTGPGQPEVGARLVEAGGLKVVFTLFMKKDKEGKGMSAQMKEHLLGIFSGLLKGLPANEAARIRTLAKFVEKDYEKIQRLVEWRQGYASSVAAVEAQIKDEERVSSAEEKEDRSYANLSRRLDAGLFCLQTVDVVLAWLVAEDAGAEKRIRELLGKRDEDLKTIAASIHGEYFLTPCCLLWLAKC